LGSAARAETLNLPATADIWLSDANAQERETSSGQHHRFKLKSVQEMAALRFDLAAAQGREILSARLRMRRIKPQPMRFIRVSTVSSRWSEGRSKSAYGKPSGATWFYADHDGQRSWSWPGSNFSDVIMGAGHSLTSWDEAVIQDGGWISIPVDRELVYALLAGASDGLAVQEGGTPAFRNHFIHSAQSSNPPVLELELGATRSNEPSAPRIEVSAAPERAGLDHGAARLSILADANTFAWEILADDKLVPCWRIPFARGEATEFVWDDLQPERPVTLQVRAVSSAGIRSAPTTVTMTASPAKPRPTPLASILPPVARDETQPPPTAFALPPLIKLPPAWPDAETPADASQVIHRANAVWDGQAVRVAGARGEYVSFQLCITGPDLSPSISAPSLFAPDGTAWPEDSSELWYNWYARDGLKRWRPAYLVPWRWGVPIQLPVAADRIKKQNNQTLYVDLYIPKDAAASYSGTLSVNFGDRRTELPLEITVFDFELPDQLGFWAELNAYQVPDDAIAYHQLAHQNRCVFNPWVVTPPLQGAGENTRVQWGAFDREVGPLLTGEAFQENRRAGVPVACMYLPYWDSWPTNLTPQNYPYEGYWPKKGDGDEPIVAHYDTGPLPDQLTDDYRAAFSGVQQQFIEHFEEQGYQQTEMQCFFGGKARHRVRYHRNAWWTTDEPYHWQDWFALRFFDDLWNAGVPPGFESRWVARADVSRPEWLPGGLGPAAAVVYYGGFDNPADTRRCRDIANQWGVSARVYGSVNPDGRSNLGTVAWLLYAWQQGATGVLPWQTLGNKGALDNGDRAAPGGGASLLVSGERFGLPVVADMRVRALRDAQQLTEYLAILGERQGLDRDQIQSLVAGVYEPRPTPSDRRPESAAAIRLAPLQAWELEGLRRALASRIVGP